MTSAETVHTIQAVRGAVAQAVASGRRVALVPTMGALHDGHLSLVRRASELAELVIVSIFVNPLQFGAGEDLERYPRTLDADTTALAVFDDVLVFAPGVDEMYPSGATSTRITAGPVGELYEGATRPGHFDGMLTVVAKLFNIVQPDVAVFGQKDAQQAHLVRQMVSDLNLPLAIEVAPIIRGQGGLALSSRNRYLDDAQARAALVLSGALHAAELSAPQGATKATDAALAAIAAEPGAELDYFALVHPDTFLPVDPQHEGAALAIVAARVGSTRLIDNRTLQIAVAQR